MGIFRRYRQLEKYGAAVGATGGAWRARRGASSAAIPGWRNGKLRLAKSAAHRVQ
jgi:hypothetical protein